MFKKLPIRIPLSIPCLGAEEERAVVECLRSGWVSSVSPQVQQFEDEFKAYLNASYAVATNSGTSALHLALLALGVDDNDEVIVPALSFVASVNPVRYVGAVPVFVDVEEETFGLDPTLLEKAITPRTKAIIATHLYGMPCQIEAIIDIAERYSIPVIEDAAESLGASVNGKKVGSFGAVGCFSFNGNKTITCGGGGMAVTQDSALAKTMRHLSVQAREPGMEISHDDVGYNHRMTGLLASVGLVQLTKLDGFIEKKTAIAKNYYSKLSNLAILKPFFKTQDHVGHIMPSYWLSVVAVTDSDDRDTLIQKAIGNGIECRPFFKPLHLLKPYKSFVKNQSFPVAEHLWRHGVCLPSSSMLSEIEQQEVISLIQDVLDRKREVTQKPSRQEDRILS